MHFISIKTKYSGLVATIPYHPKERTLQSYSAQDGLPAKGSFMQGAGTTDGNGHLYFVTDKDIVKFSSR